MQAEIQGRMKAIEMRLDEVLRTVGGKNSTAELEIRVLELERQLRDQRGVPERVEAVARRVEENRSDVEGAVAEARHEAGALREDVARLRSTVGEKASAADVATVARLKEAEVK